jgi:hypothetical protein
MTREKVLVIGIWVTLGFQECAGEVEKGLEPFLVIGDSGRSTANFRELKGFFEWLVNPKDRVAFFVKVEGQEGIPDTKAGEKPSCYDKWFVDNHGFSFQMDGFCCFLSAGWLHVRRRCVWVKKFER